MHPPAYAERIRRFMVAICCFWLLIVSMNARKAIQRTKIENETKKSKSNGNFFSRSLLPVRPEEASREAAAQRFVVDFQHEPRQQDVARKERRGDGPHLGEGVAVAP